MMMKTLVKFFWIVLLVPAILFTGCKESTEETPANESYKILTDYMVAEGMDLPDVLDGWIVGAPAEADLATFLGTYDILDIRGAADFDAGHIEGAVNTTLGGIVDAAANTTKPILVVCYTGQTAGHAVVALRLSGYSDAKVLKFGMSGWNSNTAASWEDNTGNVAVGHSNWVDAPGSVTSPETFDTPVINTTATTGAAILAEQVAKMLTGGFKGVANEAVLASPANYHINNYWASTDVEHYGHINGAYRIQPLSIAGGQMANLDASKEVVTYCWTGQTSSMITAYLSVLGYNTASLKFGANGMIYDDLESHKFATPAVDLPLVQ
jgi:rhodanese-related sulfurtransferase